MGLSIARRALVMGMLGGGAGAGVPVEYLSRFEFAADVAAPITSPYAGEVGALTLVQNDGQFSISGGALVFPAQTTAAWGDLRLYDAEGRGRTGILYTIHVRYGTVDTFSLGWARTTNGNAPVDAGLRISGSTLHSMQVAQGPGFVPTCALLALSADTDYTISLLLLPTQILIYLKTGTGAHKLMFVQYAATATLYTTMENQSAVGVSNALYVRQLPDPHIEDFCEATFNIAAPASGTEYIGNADGITELTVTAPAVLDGEATTRCGFYYRADTDLTPAWHCYFDGLGAFNLDSIAADGTRTSRINVAGVIAGDATVTLRSIHEAALHDCYTRAGTAWTKRGTQINLSLNDTVVTITPDAPAGWTIANLIDHPRMASAELAAEFDKT